MKQQVQSLLATEALHLSDSDPNNLAPSRVYEKLRSSLTVFAGGEGFRTLMRRALHIARAETPSLEAVEVRDDGSLQGLERVSDDAAVALFSCLLSLLATFIGDSLTMRLVGIAIPTTSSDIPATNPRSQ